MTIFDIGISNELDVFGAHTSKASYVWMLRYSFNLRLHTHLVAAPRHQSVVRNQEEFHLQPTKCVLI